MVTITSQWLISMVDVKTYLTVFWINHVIYQLDDLAYPQQTDRNREEICCRMATDLGGDELLGAAMAVPVAFFPFGVIPNGA